jgi:hypothetical protein
LLGWGKNLLGWGKTLIKWAQGERTQPSRMLTYLSGGGNPVATSQQQDQQQHQGRIDCNNIRGGLTATTPQED